MTKSVLTRLCKRLSRPSSDSLFSYDNFVESVQFLCKTPLDIFNFIEYCSVIWSPLHKYSITFSFQRNKLKLKLVLYLCNGLHITEQIN